MSIFKKKIEIYQVFDGEERFYITNSNKFVTYDSIVYEPAAVDRSKIELKSEMEKQSLTLTVDIDHPIAKRYLLASVESTATLRVIEFYDGQFYNLWRGRLVNTAVDGNAFNMMFENQMTKQMRSGAYRRYQRTCPYALYGKQCKVNKDNFSSDWVVSGVSSAELKLFTPSSNQFPENYFSGGMVTLSLSGITRYITKSSQSSLSSSVGSKRVEVEAIERGATVIVYTRTFYTMPNKPEYMQSEVRNNVPASEFTGTIGTTETVSVLQIYETTLTLFNVFPKDYISLGDDVIAYAGCDKLNSTCHTKFNNIVNFGGFPFIPSDNPFTGTII